MSDSSTTAMLRTFGQESHVHAHDHFQVVWAHRGQLEVDIDGQRNVLRPGRVIVIAPGERHGLSAQRGTRCLILNSTHDEHARTLAPLVGGTRTIHPSTAHLINFLAAQPQVREPAIEMLIASLAVSTPLRTRELRRQIDWAALNEWIDSRLDEALSVAMLAAHVHLSVAQFGLRCRAELGTSAIALVRARRLAHARRLLDTGAPVYRVADECGYRSPSALTAALRREPKSRASA